MSGSISIYPFEDTQGLLRFGLQLVVFMVGLYLTYRLIVKPLLLLHEERNKRTEGNVEAAKLKESKAKEFEEQYHSRVKESLLEFRELKNKEIQSAIDTGRQIIIESQEKAHEHIDKVRHKVDQELAIAKQELQVKVKDIVAFMVSKLSFVFFMSAASYSLFLHKNLLALSQDFVLIPSFMDSVFWPYFQFLIFAVCLVYFGKKPITSLLDSRRQSYRAKLSEAHQAILLAEKKLNDYKSKVNGLELELSELKQKFLNDSKLEQEKILLEARNNADIIFKDAQRVANELIKSSQNQIKSELLSMAALELEVFLKSSGQAQQYDQKLKMEALESIQRLKLG